MNKKKVSRSAREVISLYLVLVLAFMLSIRTENVYAITEQYEEEEVLELDEYDLSTIKYKLFDGKEYYDYSEDGVTYNKRPYRVVVIGLQNGLSAECVGDAQTNYGEYSVKIKIYGDATHKPIPDRQVMLKINKAAIDMSNVEFYDSTISYDGKTHNLYPTNIPSNVSICGWRIYEIKKDGSLILTEEAKEAGSYLFTYEFFVNSEDADNYNEIEPMSAVLTILGEKDPTKLDYDESSIKFESATFEYDGKEHSIYATGVRDDVILYYTGNKGNIKKGTYPVRLSFKVSDEYNPILDRIEFIMITDRSKDDSSSNQKSNVESGAKPGTEEKPGVGDDPGSEEKPTEDPEQPTEPEHTHTYVCIVTAKSNQDGTHDMIWTYSCTGCDSTYVDTEQQNCIYGDWQYIGNDTDSAYCLVNDCNYQTTRIHEHSEPENLKPNYTALKDGTHKRESSYTCESCKEIIFTSEIEDCNYSELTYKRTGINDTHLEVRDCTLCKYHTETEGTCIPIGELKYIKKYAQIYEYYDCKLCGDECKRAYHVNHVFGEWEPSSNSDMHIRYCVCIEARETADHTFEYDQDLGLMTCEECGYSKEVKPHNHGYGMYDGIGLMEIVMSPAYNELIDAGQQSNPNPSPKDYCSRYEFRCSTCGIKYYVHYSHNFKDGFCTRNYCNHIAESEELLDDTLIDEVLEDAILFYEDIKDVNSSDSIQNDESFDEDFKDEKPSDDIKENESSTDDIGDELSSDNIEGGNSSCEDIEDEASSDNTQNGELSGDDIEDEKSSDDIKENESSTDDVEDKISSDNIEEGNSSCDDVEDEDASDNTENDESSDEGIE